ANGGALGAEIPSWRREVERRLPQARLGAVRGDSDGSGHSFSLAVELRAPPPDAVRVELYAAALAAPRAPQRPLSAPSGSVYAARVATTRPADHYTARIVPQHAAAQIPLEASAIRWQR